MHSEKIEIPLNKTKLKMLLAGVVAFVLVGIWFVLAPPSSSNPILNSIILPIVGAVSVLFFGYGAYSFIGKLRDNSPGFVITPDGFTDNSSGTSAGFVSWSDVVRIEHTTVFNQTFIAIILRNPQVYIDRQPTVVKRKLMQLNLDHYRTPVNISANALQIDFNTLSKLLEEKLHTYRSLHRL